MNNSVLVSGLGGGLDILNASLFYFNLKTEFYKRLGSIRPAPQGKIIEGKEITDSYTIIDKYSKILHDGRYAESKISDFLEIDIDFFSTYFLKSGETKDVLDIKRLRDGLLSCNTIYRLFVDGGGDSMTFRPSDIIANSQETDPFVGGDAQSLEAIDDLENTIIACVSVGLDISEEGFMRNMDYLDRIGAYYGMFNPITGEQECLSSKLDFIDFDNFSLDKYLELCERILILNEKDIEQRGVSKWKSHTAVVTYHAMKQDYGMKRIFVRWEPEVNGVKGVEVKPEHSNIYFVDGGKIHQAKLKINNLI